MVNAPAAAGWTAYLLGRAVEEPAGVLELHPQFSDPRPPDRLRVAGDPVEVYVARVLLPGRVVVYQLDVGTDRVAAGIPADLLRVMPAHDPPSSLAAPHQTSELAMTLGALAEVVREAGRTVDPDDPAGVTVHLPDGSVAGLETAYVDNTCEGPRVLRLIVEDES